MADKGFATYEEALKAAGLKAKAPKAAKLRAAESKGNVRRTK